VPLNYVGMNEEFEVNLHHKGRKGGSRLFPARPKVDTLICHISIIMCSMKPEAVLFAYNLENIVDNHH